MSYCSPQCLKYSSKVLAFVAVVFLATWQTQKRPLTSLFGEQVRVHQVEVAPSCSCLNSTASEKCCDRRVLRGHKFGYILTQKLFKPFSGISRSKIRPDYIPPQATNTDYRHVVVARNIYQAVASGYLYHKSGRECWLDFNGEPRRTKKNLAWKTHIPSIPHRNNRSICTYLKEESLQDGMTAYMDMALFKWYSGILDYWNQVHAMNESANRTMFICFEDLSDPLQQEGLFYEIMDWLYPGGHSFQIPIEENAHRIYSGGHSTSHDATLRSNLTLLVRRLDAQVFNQSLFQFQQIFECGSDAG